MLQSQLLFYATHTTQATLTYTGFYRMGAGTGLLTRALLADPQWGKAIAEIKCSEPVEGMRNVFTSAVKDPRVSMSDGTFESSKHVLDGWADVILGATVGLFYTGTVLSFTLFVPYSRSIGATTFKLPLKNFTGSSSLME